MISLGYFIVICILIIIFIAVYTLAAAAQGQADQCISVSNTQPWCFIDWMCNDTTGNPYDVTKPWLDTIKNCSPLTADEASALATKCATDPTQCNPNNGKPFQTGDINWNLCSVLPLPGFN